MRRPDSNLADNDAATRLRAAGEDRSPRASRATPREEDVVLDEVLKRVEVNEDDCVADDDSDTPFIVVEDDFGRQRRVKKDSATAMRLDSYARERAELARKQLEASDLAEKRNLASYEDI